MKRTGLIAVALAAALTLACDNGRRDTVNTEAERAPGATGTTGEDRSPNLSERNFVEDVTYANNAEIELGRLASERAQNAEVKQFGQMMVKDHTAAGNELKQALTGYSVEIPSGLDDKHRDLLEKLQGLRGAEFDREYMSAMVDGHEDVKGMLEKRANERTVAKDATDADEKAEAAVNQWAAKTLPHVDQHLAKAREINDKLEAVRTTSQR